jgi:two-component system OmpR family sensor kinase
MRSLRARLVAGLLALAAIGLLLLGGIIYAEQRSFLYDRLDQQVRSAPQPAGTLLARAGGSSSNPFQRERSPERRPGSPPPGAGGPDFGLPAGTYGQLRDENGKVVRSGVLGYGGASSATTTNARPKLPSSLPEGTIRTVDGVAGSGTRYRVLAQAEPGTGGTVVVALPMRDVDSTLQRLLIVTGLVIAAVLLVLGIAAWLVVRVGLLPLDRMGHTADAIAGGDLSHRVETTDPRTEVGRLGRALNAMLDRLERAFAQRQASEDRLRQFLADASHELRTPLASIRGYAELFRLGAAREPDETEKAMRRIEEEAKRMGVLVEDLLTLARLDEVRDAEHGAVDLATLTRDAVDDARATAPERTIELEASGATVVLGDADGLRQLLANLLRNALVHTPAGTPIEVRLTGAAATGSAGEVRLEVRDHGPGLPTDDPSALFERFWRAETGRSRGRGGAGLGLAIVAGVVDAHRGRVEARNAPDGGARFVVELPATAGSGSSQPPPTEPGPPPAKLRA